MRIQRSQNNNYNKPSFSALIIDKNMKEILEDISTRELQEIREVRESLKNTKYYDMHVQKNI